MLSSFETIPSLEYILESIYQNIIMYIFFTLLFMILKYKKTIVEIKCTHVYACVKYMNIDMSTLT